MSTVVILGMHRSGTSCLTHALHVAGLHLGADLMNESSRDNLQGHWENWEAVRINDRILTNSGGAWDHVPANLVADDACQSAMQAFLQSLATGSHSGWKDPRTTLTFPLWKPYLSDYRLVVAVRNPLSVARSMQVRDNLPLEQGFSLWADYNERLLQCLDQETSPILWFDYDGGWASLSQQTLVICQALGLAWNDEVEAIINPFLRHHQQPELGSDPRACKIYAEIQHRIALYAAEQQSAVLPPNSQAVTIDVENRTQECSDIADVHAARSLAQQIAQLSQAHTLQNGIVQQLNLQIANKFAVLTQMQQLLDETRAWIHDNLQATTTNVQQALSESHQWRDTARQLWQQIDVQVTEMATELRTERERLSEETKAECDRLRHAFDVARDERTALAQDLSLTRDQQQELSGVVAAHGERLQYFNDEHARSVQAHAQWADMHAQAAQTQADILQTQQQFADAQAALRQKLHQAREELARMQNVLQDPATRRADLEPIYAQLEMLKRSLAYRTRPFHLLRRIAGLFKRGCQRALSGFSGASESVSSADCDRDDIQRAA